MAKNYHLLAISAGHQPPRAMMPPRNSLTVSRHAVCRLSPCKRARFGTQKGTSCLARDALLTSVRRKVYAEPALKILGIITGNNAHPRVGTLGLSVRVTMKTSNGCHAKRQRLCVYDITRTLRPSVPTGWVATWLMAKCRFIGIYGTKIEKSCTSLIPNSRPFRIHPIVWNIAFGPKHNYKTPIVGT